MSTKAPKKIPPIEGFPKVPGLEKVSEFFPKIERKPDSYSASLIDIIKSIRSDEDGNQYQEPLYKVDPRDRVVIYRGPYLDEIINAFEANKEAGGTKDFQKFKKDLYNRDWYKFKIDVRDYLDVSMAEPKPIKQAMEDFENRPYEGLDVRETLLKIIKDRTGIGISGLFEEEMSDRLKDDPEAFTSPRTGIAGATA